jgi:hypothetical protein
MLRLLPRAQRGALHTGKEQFWVDLYPQYKVLRNAFLKLQFLARGGTGPARDEDDFESKNMSLNFKSMVAAVLDSTVST